MIGLLKSWWCYFKPNNLNSREYITVSLYPGDCSGEGGEGGY